MDFYLIPSANGLPRELAGTQGEMRAACKARGLRGRKPEELAHEVPTNKAGLKGYINALLAQLNGAAPKPIINEPRDDFEPEPDVEIDASRHLFTSELADDGHPNCRSAFTSTQVAALALPKSEKVRDVCHLIAKMTPAELGFVALEVIARGARLGGIQP